MDQEKLRTILQIGETIVNNLGLIEPSVRHG